MINFDDVIKENIKEHNPNWAQISDHPYGTLIIGGSGSGKTNSLFNLINQQPDIDKYYLYAKDPYEASILMILRLLLNTQIIWMVFSKKLKNTIQIRYVNY